MAVEVKQWMAKDGTLFCEKRDAEEHERYVERIRVSWMSCHLHHYLS